jgi:hypothetical protein
MKNFFFVLLAIAGGMIGGYTINHIQLGATTARTTITNPWTFANATTTTKNIDTGTSNTATSSILVGCIQTTATSTATPVKLEFVTTGATSTYAGTAFWGYGKCPRI